jgi:aspartate aminotransferase
LTFEPFYSNYSAIAAFTGIHITAAPTTLATGFHLPEEAEIVKRIGPKTKAILFTNPGNPTGAVFRKDEVELLVKIAKEHKLFLISDEPYREYAFDQPSVSLLAYMQEIPDQIILMDSLSKRYSLCGARVGMFITKNIPLRTGIMKLAMARLSGGIIDQVVGAKMTEVTDDYITGVVTEYKKRRDVLYAELSKIPGVQVPVPEGAFYTMVKLPVIDAEAFAIFLLEQFRDNNETVMLAPGAGFYSSPGVGKDEVRIAYVLNCEKLKRCCELISMGLEKYKELGLGYIG